MFFFVGRGIGDLEPKDLPHAKQALYSWAILSVPKIKFFYEIYSNNVFSTLSIEL
jgi:hypothetical protein